MSSRSHFFILTFCWLSIMLVFIARHHKSNKIHISKIFHGRVYWVNGNTSMLRSKTLLHNTNSSLRLPDTYIEPEFNKMPTKTSEPISNSKEPKPEPKLAPKPKPNPNPNIVIQPDNKRVQHQGKMPIPEFIHITKTGGTAVEMAGAKYGISWSSCHTTRKVIRNKLRCPESEDLWDLKIPYGTPKQHTLTKYLITSVLKGKKTFTVVRNPYTRMVSEYYCPWSGYKGKGKNNPVQMNTWLRKQMENQKGQYKDLGGHFTPQYMYVYDDDKQIVDTVLHFEHLKTEFENFMRQEGLPVRLLPKPVNVATSSALTVDDLDEKTIAMIHEVYAKDFELLGYTINKPKKMTIKSPMIDESPTIGDPDNAHQFNKTKVSKEAVDFIVIGVQKGGTSSIIAYLNQHPDVYIYPHEIHFFDKYYDKGIQWYEKHFESEKRIRGEKTPIYCYDKKSIDRIHSHYPNVKLIMLLREPIQRAYSQWNMCQARKTHPLKNVPFKKVIQNDLTKKDLVIRETDILQRGYYDDQIEYILSKFDRKNLYIGISEEIKANKNAEYAKIFNFLGVHLPDEFNTNVDRHIIKYRTPINDDMKQLLYNIYEPHISRTYAMLGRKIDFWEKYYTQARIRPQNNFNLSKPMVVIHVGKTGGSTTSESLKGAGIKFKQLHTGRSITMRSKIRNGDFGLIVINIRDPISRTISAYNWKHPRNCKTNPMCTWRDNKYETQFYDCFPNIHALFYNNGTAVCAKLFENVFVTGTRIIGHISRGLDWYLNDLDIFNHRFTLVRQEHMGEDMSCLMQSLGHAYVPMAVRSNYANGYKKEYPTSEELLQLKSLPIIKKEMEWYKKLLKANTPCIMPPSPSQI